MSELTEVLEAIPAINEPPTTLEHLARALADSECRIHQLDNQALAERDRYRELARQMDDAMRVKLKEIQGDKP